MGNSKFEPPHGRGSTTGVFSRGYVENTGVKLAPHAGHVSNFCGLKHGPLEPVQLLSDQGVRAKLALPSRLGTQPRSFSNPSGRASSSSRSSNEKFCGSELELVRPRLGRSASDWAGPQPPRCTPLRS